MTEGSIPVDLFNPGQVFACMGFLEAADALVGEAEGRFDWSNEGNVRFRLRAGGDENPFGRALGFLAAAEIRRYAPTGYADPRSKKKSAATDDNGGHAPDHDAPDP
ncbi:MAG TPA: type I-U CRISPR-associated protein Cas8c, partial [Candidatus Krumholzibacteria bacterium]